MQCSWYWQLHIVHILLNLAVSLPSYYIAKHFDVVGITYIKIAL